jgi:hypothetical protein
LAFIRRLMNGMHKRARSVAATSDVGILVGNKPLAIHKACRICHCGMRTMTTILYVPLTTSSLSLSLSPSLPCTHLPPIVWCTHCRASVIGQAMHSVVGPAQRSNNTTTMAIANATSMLILIGIQAAKAATTHVDCCDSINPFNWC